jgi:hypothetical protein
MKRIVAGAAILSLLFLAGAAGAAEEGPPPERKTMIAYLASRFVTLNHPCFREPACAKEASALLKGTPGVILTSLEYEPIYAALPPYTIEYLGE